MRAKIKLTKTMLEKSIIDANKTVQKFLLEDFGMKYTDPFFEIGCKFTVPSTYIDGEEVNINFYRSKRGDKRISIQKLKKYADAGDIVSLYSDSESDGDGTRIFIQVYRPVEEDAA
tara:strand:- start:601 stop:948 length:348 start_codon:yes stop_codon:yes gene_type:complete